MTISPSELMPFVEFDKLDKRPITEALLEGFRHNFEKWIEVYCASCVYRTKTNLPAPICGMCGNSLFVVVRSVLTQEQQNELAGRNSQST